MPATAPTATPTTPTAALSGIHRGEVVDNADPLRQGRIQVHLPSLQLTTGWALPCAPFGGNERGLLGLPGVGTDVWLAFEAGDVDRPVWLGVFWPGGLAPGADALTTLLADAHNRVALVDRPAAGAVEISRTAPGGSQAPNRIRVDDAGIELRSGASTVRVDPTGVTISCGTTTARLDAASLQFTCGATRALLQPTHLDLVCGATTVSMTVTDVAVTGPPTQVRVGPLGATVNGAPLGPRP